MVKKSIRNTTYFKTIFYGYSEIFQKVSPLLIQNKIHYRRHCSHLTGKTDKYSLTSLSVKQPHNIDTNYS